MSEMKLVWSSETTPEEDAENKRQRKAAMVRDAERFRRATLLFLGEAIYYDLAYGTDVAARFKKEFGIT